MRYNMGVFLLIGFKNKQTKKQKYKNKNKKIKKHVLQHNFALN